MPEMHFAELRKLYEQSVDLDKMSNSNEGLLFFKIRSLTKDNLKQLCIDKKLIKEGEKPSEWKMRELVFGNATVKELNEFILGHKHEVKKISNRDELIKGVKEVESHAPAVFMDNFDTVLRRVVRDKTIQGLSQLDEKIDGIVPKLKSYVEWSWFNQNTNDLIEDIFNNHSKIIPTLRRVKGVDFFVKVDGKEYPVDLKLTFLPKEFISIYSKQEKNIGEIITMVKNDKNILAEWLYANQNPRLFNNNIRFFVILMDKSDLGSSWKLKAEYEMIQKEVNSFLDRLTNNDTIDITYEYTKDDKVAGKYKTKCFLLIIEK